MRRALRNLSQWIGLFVLLALGAVLLVFLSGASKGGTSDQVELIEQAVRRAAVQCYALEGAYPPDVAYLQAHYGLTYDESRYFIHYRVEGSNLLPDIEVFESLEGESP